jgi:hypothetical protein
MDGWMGILTAVRRNERRALVGATWKKSTRGVISGIYVSVWVPSAGGHLACSLERRVIIIGSSEIIIS